MADRGRCRRRLRVLDALRVLDPPRGLPLRARGGLRRAAPLDHPRRAPRPPERPAAPRDAAVRLRAALDALLRGVLARARHPALVRVRGRVPRGLPRLRHDPLPPAPPQAEDADGQAAARAPHAPPLPGRHDRLRYQRPVLGLGLRDALAEGEQGQLAAAAARTPPALARVPP